MQCWRACGSMIWAGGCQTLESGPEPAVAAVQAAAPGAERAAGPARAGISDHRAGGDAGRNHHRHQHGRRVPWHHAGTTAGSCRRSKGLCRQLSACHPDRGRGSCMAVAPCVFLSGTSRGASARLIEFISAAGCGGLAPVQALAPCPQRHRDPEACIDALLQAAARTSCSAATPRAWRSRSWSGACCRCSPAVRPPASAAPACLRFRAVLMELSPVSCRKRSLSCCHAALYS